MKQLPEDIEERIAFLIYTLTRERDIALVLRAHIYIEHELKFFNEKRLVDISALGRLAQGFSNNLRMAQALGLKSEMVPPFNKLNDMRNDIAHKLDYHLTEQKVREMKSCLSALQRNTYDALSSKLKLKERIDNSDLAELSHHSYEHDFIILILGLCLDLLVRDKDNHGIFGIPDSLSGKMNDLYGYQIKS